MKAHSNTWGDLNALAGTDIRTIDPETVSNIQDIHVDTELPLRERILDTVRQMNGNPFVYRCGNILVKTSFCGTRPLQEVLEECLEKT